MDVQNSTVTKELLHELFEYRDGVIYWKRKPSALANRTKVGSQAGHKNKEGYTNTMVNKKYYGNHRLIFMMHYGYFPEEVDHKDNNPSNNKIENLRAATHKDNMRNTKFQKDNKTGVKGVTWDKSKNKWQAGIGVNDKFKLVGRFDTIEDAEKAIKEARKKYHGEFANHG